MADEHPTVPTLMAADAPPRLGPYHVRELLGRGGMGSVYRATTPGGTHVALKIIREDLLHQPEVRRRFTREARAAARLEHPNITRLLDFGVDGGKTYMAMELITGGSLSDWRPSPPPGDLLLTVIRQILGALAYAHARGVVHRDLKPDNVLLSVDGEGHVQAKVMDFGVAWFRDEHVADSTNENVLIGTPAYMAPEQALKSTDVSPAADLYALGVMLFELITGRLPYEGSSTAATLFAHLREPIPPLDPRPGYAPDEALQAVVRRLLAKHPAGRYMFAIDALNEIERCRLSGTGSPDGVSRAARDTTGQWGADTTILPAHGTEFGDEPASESAPYALFGFRQPPFAGRDAELDALHGAARVARETGSGTVALVAGELGMGRSRLVRELREQLEEYGLMQAWTGTCDPSGADPDDALREAFRRGLGVAGLSAAETEQRIQELLHRQRIDDEWEQQAMLEFLLPDRIDPERRLLTTEQAQWALLERVLVRAGRDRPVLLTLEDVHVSDGGPARFVQWLVETPGEARWCVVLTWRPELGGEGTRIGRDLSELRTRAKKRLTELHLRRMTLDAMQTMVRGSVPLHRDVADAIAMRAGGNPMLAIELVRHLVDSGRLEGYGEAPSAPELLGDLPDGIGAILRRRLDEAAGARADGEAIVGLWEQLAVLGMRVTIDLAVTMFAVDGDAGELDRALTAAVAAGVLVEEDPSVFRFESAMLRDALLERADEAGRREPLERRAAQARMDHFAEAIDEQGMEIGRHLERGGRAAAAGAYYLRYARWARQRQQYPVALDAYLALRHVVEAAMPETADSMILASLGLADAWLQLADFDAAQREAIAARTIAADTDRDSPPEATRVLAMIAHRIGNTREARMLYQAAASGFARTGGIEGQARCEYWQAQLELAEGRVPEAEAILRRCRERFAAIGHPRGEASVTWALGRAALTTGLLDEARELVERARQEYRAASDRHGEAMCSLLYAEIARAQWGLAETSSTVAAYFERARDELLAMGDRHHAARATLWLGLTVESAADHGISALRWLRDALASFEAMGDRQQAAVVRLAVARMVADTGPFDAAVDDIERSLERDERERIDDSLFVTLLVDVGRQALLAGRTQLARRVLETANYKLERIAETTTLYDRVDEVEYLLHELDEHDAGRSGEGDGVVDLLDDES